MTDAIAYIESPKVKIPPSYLQAYGARKEHTSLMDVDPYEATLLVQCFESTRNTSVRQHEAHVTFGQFETVYPTSFGFQFGTPLVSSIWKEYQAEPEWISRVLQLCAHGSEDAALKEVSLVTTRYKSNRSFTKLSMDLVSFDLKMLPDIVLVALLRNTFAFRSQLSCWNSLIARTEKLLGERGRDPRRLLRGLKNYF